MKPFQDPRYHSNCDINRHSGSDKPYAFTQQSRKAPTYKRVRTFSSEGMGERSFTAGIAPSPALCGFHDQLRLRHRFSGLKWIVAPSSPVVKVFQNIFISSLRLIFSRSPAFPRRRLSSCTSGSRRRRSWEILLRIENTGAPYAAPYGKRRIPAFPLPRSPRFRGG